MHKILAVLFLFMLPLSAMSQLLPADGSKLHYRRIGFSFPAKEAVVKYKIEIAIGDYQMPDTFKRHIVRSVESRLNKLIVEVPYFGQPYTWLVTYYLKSGKAAKSDLFHFATLSIPEVDTNILRVRVLKPAIKYKDDYVFIDGHKALYDMKGNAVWFLPMREQKAIGGSEIRDLKLSPQGTITYLQHDRAFEVNYNGDSLWKAPNNGVVSGDSLEKYHHEFTRLGNGHYMVLGTESMFWSHRFGAGVDSNDVLNSTEEIANAQKKKPNYLKIDFGTLIEYDTAGNVVWYWKSSNYFMESDLVNYKPEHRTKVIDVHENAFFFDEENQVVYISFKNISRVLKIKYPEGTVLNSYGEVYKAGVPPAGNGLFCDQHACRHSKKGYLYLYNNNACNDSTELPTILIMKEAASGADSLTKVWEYQCTADGININPNIKDMKERQKRLEQNNMKPRLGRGTMLRSTSGGNVIELPDHSIFVCMNTQYSKIFIVSPEKKILWSAIPERYYPGKKEWFITPQQYRASIITRKELDKLIWSAEK